MTAGKGSLCKTCRWFAKEFNDLGELACLQARYPKAFQADPILTRGPSGECCLEYGPDGPYGPDPLLVGSFPGA